MRQQAEGRAAAAELDFAGAVVKPSPSKISPCLAIVL
jgi:hypothetical protein